ncbi:MAG: hypothetical protein LUQ51_01515, partial [Methanothrix sp.]|nr:hypothetical protein [Methanothrix sp.]
MNSSQLSDDLQKVFPILENPLWIVAIFIIIGVAFIVAKKILEKWSDDVYDEHFKNKKTNVS